MASEDHLGRTGACVGVIILAVRPLTTPLGPRNKYATDTALLPDRRRVGDSVPAGRRGRRFDRAVAGEPFGVATIEVPFAQPLVGQTLPPIRAIDVDSAGNAGGRVFFPFSEDVRVDVPLASETPVPRPGNGRLLGRLGSLIREIAKPDPNQSQTVARRVTFLFRGDAPLTVQLTDGVTEIGTYPVAIDRSAPAWQAAVLRWWDGYTDAAGSQERAADYPTLVEDYLIAMLSRRLSLPLPSWYPKTPVESDELIEALKLIAGGEGLSRVLFRSAAVGTNVNASGEASATLPLPAPPRWSPLFDDASLIDVPVEPLATKVAPVVLHSLRIVSELHLVF